MTCGIALTESVTSLGKCTKLQLNNEQGWLRSALFFCLRKKFQLFCKKVLTKCICCGIIVLQLDTRKESRMSKKIKVNISLATEIYEKGKAEAERLGIPFSTYVSVLIAKDNTEKKNKK